MFGMFETKPETAPVAPTTPTPAEPGNLPPAGDPNAVAPTGDPAAPAAAPVTPVDNSPLAEYKDIWETVSTEGEPNANPQALDPAKLQETINKSDFSSVISPENMAAITAGGEEATKAVASSMNQVAQHVMQNSILASNKMIEQAIDGVNKAWESKLPQLLKQQNLNESLSDSNPIFKNPAVKPIMDATQAQLAAKFPNATVAELTTMTQEYIKAMGEQFAPKPVTANPSEDNTDWDNFMKS